MRFGSVCSGIEAASVAWHPLGWETAWLSEIDKFPAAVLKHRFPNVENLGDMTLLPDLIRMGAVEAPDVLVGGTPCQAFSVAGMRKSLADERGNLTLTYVGIANAIDEVRRVRGELPAIIVWENVPGVLATDDNAFGCFLAGLVGEDDALLTPGGKWPNAGLVVGPERTLAWRVLDAQYFGVAQRRRRVFVVASARKDFCPGTVLFEPESVRRDTAPNRGEGLGTSPALEDGTFAGCWWNGGQVTQTLDAVLSKGQMLPEKNRFPVVLVADATAYRKARRAQNTEDYETWVDDGAANTLNTFDISEIRSTHIVVEHGPPVVARRLTVVECERLQGFPDDWTRLPSAVKKNAEDPPDGPRYKAIGNSMAVPVMAWIGRRINQQVKAQP